MAIARANGKLKGKPPKLSARQRAHLLKLLQTREHTIAELAELFSVSRATVYREIARAGDRTRGAHMPPPGAQADDGAVPGAVRARY
jgi:DNA invertase Pin-like site-specific DNA recombinase